MEDYKISITLVPIILIIFYFFLGIGTKLSGGIFTWDDALFGSFLVAGFYLLGYLKGRDNI